MRTLSRELGVPPLAETTRLYEAISEGTLEAPAAPPAAAAPALRRAPLVGRAAEWEALLSAYDGIADDGRAVLLEGEAGIGKTRLAEEFAAYARERGAAVLGGRAYEEEAALAYGPLVEALRRRLRDDDAWVARRRATARCARRHGCCPTSAPPLPRRSTVPAAQARFLDGVWETLAAAAAGPVPGVLVDRGRPVGRRGHARTADLRAAPAGRAAAVRAADLAGAAAARPPRSSDLGAAWCRLERLSEDEVGELLRAAVPEPSPGSRGASTRRRKGCRSCSSSTSTRWAATATGRCRRARASCCWRGSTR